MKNKILSWVMTAKGNQFQVLLLAKTIVCPRCDGQGVHDHQAFSSGVGDLDDPDFNESYFRGDYDVRCEECAGKNVIDVVDHAKLSDKMLKRVYKQEYQQYRDEQEAAGERRWGC